MGFGLSLLLPDRRAITTLSWAFLLSAGTFLLWLIAYVFYPVAVPRADVVGWFSAAEIWARYLLGLPSGLITAWGLVRQARELRRDNLHGHVRSLFVVAAFFGAYGLAAGLVVPGGSVWLAAIVNTETFQDVTGLPVQIVRGTAMLVVAFFTHQLLDIFNVETSRRLQRAEAEQAILKERERIARDLHDGIMQTLYGVGLGLRQVVDNPASGKEVAAALTAELSRALAEMRGYVLGLREEGVSGNDLVRGDGGADPPLLRAPRQPGRGGLRAGRRRRCAPARRRRPECARGAAGEPLQRGAPCRRSHRQGSRGLGR